MKIIELAVIGFFVVLVKGFLNLFCGFWFLFGNCKTQIMKQWNLIGEKKEKEKFKSVFIYLGNTPSSIILPLPNAISS